MATWTTYDQVGKKEDISDVISNISPTETPFQRSIGTEKIHNIVFQWQEEELEDPAANARVEGADAPTEEHTATSMRTNYPQLFMKSVKVSGTSEAVQHYGRDNELARQLANRGKAIKRDLEHALVGVSNAAVAGNSSTAREMASYDQMIDSGNEDENSGTPRAFSETIALSVMQKVYDSGGEATVMMIKPSDASIVAGWAAASGTRQRDFGTGKKVVNAVKFYEGPWGEVRVVLNRRLLSTTALFYDPANWKLATLRPWFKEKLAKTGDAEKWMIAGEFSLKHVNFKASGIAKDLS